MIPSLILQFAQLFGPSITPNNVDSVHLFNTISTSCSISGAPSCQNSSAVDTCCTEFPGGLLMQTQFWDSNVPGSPSDSWTIHGLWPDNCDGTYVENCDRSRAYNIPELLTEQGASDTLDYMQQYWLNADGTNEHLWNHEWVTHGTCYSTIQPSCLPDGTPSGSEAVAYFQRTIQLFQTLPTYTWLQQAGITPSRHQTYMLSDILSALESGSGGYTPAVGCSHGRLDAISWYYHLRGSLLDGEFVPINSPKGSTCPHRGIQYLPKEGY